MGLTMTDAGASMTQIHGRVKDFAVISMKLNAQLKSLVLKALKRMRCKKADSRG